MKLKTLLLITIISTAVFGNDAQTKIKAYYESLDFTNSKQKEYGYRVGGGADISVNNSTYQFIYEHGSSHTKKPPLSEDLEIDKLFLKYNYNFKNNWHVNVNYINVLQDNIAPTAHGSVYGLGTTYEFSKALQLNFTQYYLDYKEFDSYQSDLTLDYKLEVKDIHIKLSSITKAIYLDGYKDDNFSKNAEQSYLTTALKLHSHYNSYHFGGGIYLGRRAFAVMLDGFKLQHHAMEFDRTYAIGAGKTFNNFTLRVQYILQRAIELPSNTQNVEVQNLKVMTNYKF